MKRVEAQRQAFQGLHHQPHMMESAKLNPCLSRVRTAHPRFFKGSSLLQRRSENMCCWGGILLWASADHHCLGQLFSLLSTNFILHLTLKSNQEPLLLNTFPNASYLRFLLFSVFCLILGTWFNLGHRTISKSIDLKANFLDSMVILYLEYFSQNRIITCFLYKIVYVFYFFGY